MAAGAGRAVAAAAMVVAVAVALPLPLLVDGAYKECYDYCFKDCIAKDKNMRDYCSYACDKTCAPDAGLPVNCQLACARDSCRRRRRADGNDMEACYGECYDSCQAMAALPRPLRAGASAVRPAALPDHPFHEKKDAVRPAALPDHPFHEKQDAVRPAVNGPPVPQEAPGAVRPAALPDHPFHKKKQGPVWPAVLPDHPFHKKQGDAHREWGTVLP